ncbi:MAG: dienelactone hydrolase family protein [Chloroflexota bacterium]
MAAKDYLAQPMHNTGGAVLVLHPWWGLNADVRAYCDRLADKGFVALAPDLYDGAVTDDIAEAETLASALDERVDAVRVALSAAIEGMDVHCIDGRAVAVVGFSLGAFYALDLSACHPALVDRVVLYYGAGPADFTKAQATYLGHFAADDPYEPAENVAWLEGEMFAAGRDFTFHTYPDTGHWFAEPSRPDAYNEAADDLAWARTLAFLQG